jgi:hypothetical protein
MDEKMILKDYNRFIRFGELVQALVNKKVSEANDLGLTDMRMFLPNEFIEKFNVQDVTEEIDSYLKAHGLSFQLAKPLSERTEFPRTITYEITESCIRVRTFFVYRGGLYSENLAFFYNSNTRQGIYASRNQYLHKCGFFSAISQVGTFNHVEDALNDAKERFLNVAVKGEAALEEVVNNYASFEQAAMKIIRYVLSKYHRSENLFNTVKRKLNLLKSQKSNVEALSLGMARPLDNFMEAAPNITREFIEKEMNRNEFIMAILSDDSRIDFVN